ncbi:hypothetical protein Pfo_016851 [Paulownia fortunei]|nr:hypothetical protein Pfo_016851 [Paulownia fortunei]
MENSRCSSTKSRRTFQFMFVIIVLVMASQLCPADCRALRPVPEATAATAASGCGQVEGAGDTMSMTTAFSVSSNNSSTSNRLSGRGLAFVLASGPSKRGPGH